jgi:hypothetical protein
MLVVKLDASRNAATVIGYRNRIVGMNGDHDVVAMPGQSFINGVIDNLEHHVVQPGAIRGIADVHAGAFAYCLQTFQLLNRRFIVGGGVILITHSLFSCFTWNINYLYS